jgi:hypothetical protein
MIDHAKIWRKMKGAVLLREIFGIKREIQLILAREKRMRRVSKFLGILTL